MATTTIEPDSDLEQMRAWIERFKEDEEEEVLLAAVFGIMKVQKDGNVYVWSDILEQIRSVFLSNS